MALIKSVFLISGIHVGGKGLPKQCGHIKGRASIAPRILKKGFTHFSQGCHMHMQVYHKQCGQIEGRAYQHLWSQSAWNSNTPPQYKHSHIESNLVSICTLPPSTHSHHTKHHLNLSTCSLSLSLFFSLCLCLYV